MVAAGAAWVWGWGTEPMMPRHDGVHRGDTGRAAGWMAGVSCQCR